MQVCQTLLDTLCYFVSDKHLYHVVSLLPSPNMVTVLVTPDDLEDPEIPQVVTELRNAPRN
jgi:hypothetical protein